MALVKRLKEFQRCWLSNPAALLEFAELIAAVAEVRMSGRELSALTVWIEEERATAKYLGIKR